MSDQADTTPGKGLPDWSGPFLEALAETANVAAAAQLVAVHRTTAYCLRKRSPEFAGAWDAAMDVAVDALEAEVRRRALHGTTRPVYYKGEECGRIREYSDTLAMFLLKAHRPEKYRDRVTTQHEGKMEIVVRYVGPDGDPEPTMGYAADPT